MNDPMVGLALLQIAVALFVLSVFGIDGFARQRRAHRADAEFRAARLLLWAKQHAALLKRQRAGEGIEA